MSSSKLQSVVCPGCSCLCDDIELTVEENKITHVVNPCEKGSCFFQPSVGVDSANESISEAELNKRIENAADILRNAKAPLVCGLDGLTTQAQKVAVELGREISATINIGFGAGAAASVLALQSQGKVTATLGEISTRSDLVVFWHCDPAVTHPRLIEKYCGNAKTVLVTDQKSTTAEFADEVIQLSSQRQIETIDKLRMMIGGIESDGCDPETARLFELITSAKYGAVFYGHGNAALDHDAVLENLFQLVRKLNDITRFVVLPLSGDGNQLSGESVLAWNTGFPIAVNFRNSKPEFNGRQFSAQSVLESGACDAVLVCSNQSLDDLSVKAKGTLEVTRSVVLSNGKNVLAELDDLTIPVTRPGIDDDGDWARLDDVLLPLSKPLQSNRKSAEWVMREILRLVQD